MSLSSLHYTNTLPVHAPALSPSHLFHCSQCCNMRLMCAFVLLLHLAFTLLWPARQQLTKFTVYSWRCRLSHTVSTFVGLFGVFFLASCCFRFFSVVVIQLRLRCHNIQFPLDSGGGYGKHSTKGTALCQYSFLLAFKKGLQIAPGVCSPQLLTCIQFCCSYLFFMGPSFVFTETMRPYSSVFMGFHRSLCQMCFVYNLRFLVLFPSTCKLYMWERLYCKHAVCIQQLSFP